MFTGRFVVQWLSSERNKRVTIPKAFWMLSIGGSLLLLTYAVHRGDIVFTLGQSSGLFIYIRNLQMSLRESREKQAEANKCEATADSALASTAGGLQHKAA